MDARDSIRSKFLNELDDLDHDSVKNLLAWQQENREDIEKAINTYAKQIAEG